jgi:hypothetical protein
VKILEDEDERPLLGERFEEPAPRGEGLATAVAPEAGVCLEADQGSKMRLDPAGIALLRECVFDSRVELLGCLRLVVPLRDSCLRLDDLRKCPEGHPVAVGETAALAPGDELGVGVDDLRELVHESALSHAWDGDEGDELWRPLVAGTLERISEDRELALTTHELSARVMRDVHAEARSSSGCLPYGDRLGLALRLDCWRLAVLDRLPRRAIGHLVRQDSVHGCCALQAGGGVDDVSRGHSLAFRRAGPQGDERLPGRNSDAELEAFLDREVADRESGADRALRIVLVRRRRAEERHDGIPDELLDGAAVALELATDAVVVRTEDGAHLLRVELLGLRRKPDKVAEEDGDDLALLACDCFGSERRAAHPAQAEALGVLLAAARTADHAQRVRRRRPVVSACGADQGLVGARRRSGGRHGRGRLGEDAAASRIRYALHGALPVPRGEDAVVLGEPNRQALLLLRLR